MRSYLYLNYNCNCNCLFCASDETNTDIGKKELSFEEVKSFLHANPDKNEVFINGGEPTIHKDFLKIISYSKENYDKVSLATNGILFSNEIFLKEAINNGLSQIVTPLYSLDEQEHDYIVQKKGAFKQVMKGIENINKLIPIYNLKVNIKLLVSKLSYKNNPSIVAYVKNNFENITNMSLYGLHIGAKALNKKEECVVSFSQAKPYTTETIKKLLENDFQFHLDHIPLCSFDSSLLEKLFDKKAITYSLNQNIKRPDKPSFELTDPYYIGEECNHCDFFQLCPKVYGKNAAGFDYGLKALTVDYKTTTPNILYK